MLPRARAFRIPCLLCALLSLALAGAARADENDFRLRTGERLLNPYTISPRALGMGGAYAAVNDGAHGVYQNPASLGGVEKHELISVLGYDRIAENSKDATFTTVTIGGAMHVNSLRKEYYPVEQFGNQAFGFRFTNVCGTNAGFNGMRMSSNLVNFAYGRTFNYGRVLGGVSLGLHNTGINDDDWKDLDLSRYELRTGVIIRVSRLFSLGGVFAYGNGETEENIQGGEVKGEVHNMELRGGASWQLNDQMMLAADLSLQRLERAEKDTSPREIEKHDVLRFSLGAEMVVRPETMTARAGLFLINDDMKLQSVPEYQGRDDICGGISGGLSYFKDNWTAEYDLQLKTTGDYNHAVSLMLEF